MSNILGSLPVELFLEVVSHLEPIDKTCLGLTCRGFKSLLPYIPPSTINANHWSEQIELASGFIGPKQPGYMINPQGYDYMSELISRLHRDGLDFWHNDSEDYDLCAKCLKVTPIGKFFEFNSFKTDEFTPMCDNCLPLSLEECPATLSNVPWDNQPVPFFIRVVCAQAFHKSNIHQHLRANGTKENVCHKCHGVNGMKCTNPDCMEWPLESLADRYTEATYELFEMGEKN